VVIVLLTSFISGGNGGQRGFEFLQHDSSGNYQNMCLKNKIDGNAIVDDVPVYVSFSNFSVSGSSTINGAVTLGDACYNGYANSNFKYQFENNVTIGDLNNVHFSSNFSTYNRKWNIDY
jgi:hypothetical protein